MFYGISSQKHSLQYKKAFLHCQKCPGFNLLLVSFFLQTFMVKMFWCLFALPSPKQRHYPKCKSQLSRSATYDLLVEMVKNSLNNYKVLHELVLKQHNKGRTDSHVVTGTDSVDVLSL